MKYLVTGKEMKYLDENTIHTFSVPELVLMEQAAMQFVHAFQKIGTFRKGIVFCGTGNNGADGLAIARLLNEKGIETHICKIDTVWNINSRKTESYKVQETICTSYGFPELDSIEGIFHNSYDFGIDAVFGIGLSGPVKEEYLPIIQIIDTIPATKVAVDIASGVNADNGQIMGTAVHCDYTITFSYEKIGQILWPGNEYSGRLICVDIGITDRSWLHKKATFCALEEQDLIERSFRPAHSNKGTFGKLLLVAGSKDMAGAAILSAKAAYHSGVGMVKIITCASNREIIQTSLPEALLKTYEGTVSEEFLQKEIAWADAVVIGPGLGTDDVAKCLVTMVHKYATVPVVWDADALNIWSEDLSPLHETHKDYIFTPHLGEFSRLTGNDIAYIQKHFTESAIDFAKSYELICVLKDFRTIIAGPYGKNTVNLSGNNGMATAGSGDVLSGIIGAFAAQGYAVYDAAAFGVFVHGLAGDIAQKQMGTHGVTASAIIEGIKEVWNKVENK